MNNKTEYLTEENYQRTNKKVSRTGTALLAAGVLSIAAAVYIIFYITRNSGSDRGSMVAFNLLMIFLLFIGFVLLGIGIMLKVAGHGREINAYMAQQQMPLVKEGMEKLAPSAGAAAREITEGIKDGLKDD